MAGSLAAEAGWASQPAPAGAAAGGALHQDSRPYNRGHPSGLSTARRNKKRWTRGELDMALGRLL